MHHLQVISKSSVLFLTEETLYNIERGQTMAHYCTHLCRQRTILYTITADKEVWTNLNMLAWVTNESVTNERL